MTLSFYNLPIQNGKINKYYGGGNNLPSPIFVLDTTKAKNQVSYQTTTPFLMNLRTKTNINFNYVIIENFSHYEKTTTYWFLLNKSNILGKNNFEYDLKLDIFMTFNLLKPTTKNIPIKIIRKSENWLTKDNNKLIPNSNRNPKIWNNKEFELVPGIRKISNVNPINNLLNKGDISNFETWAPPHLKNPYFELYSGSRGLHSLPHFDKELFLKKLATIINFNSHPSHIGYNLFEIAIITTEHGDKFYVPVFYPRANFKPVELDANNKINWKKFNKDNNIFNKDYSSLTFLEHNILNALAFFSNFATNNNSKDNIIKNIGLKNIIFVSNLFFYDKFFENFQYIVLNKTKKPIELMGNDSDLEVGFIQNKLNTLLILNDKTDDLVNLKINDNITTAKRLSTFDFREKLEIPINNEIWKWENYNNISLYSEKYFGYYFDFLGQQITTNNRLIFKNKYMYFYQLFYNESEIFYYWQSEKDQYLKSFQNTFFISFTKDIGDINFALRKNYYDARLSQVDIQKRANLRQIDNIVNNQIFTNNQLTRQQNTTAFNLAENQKQATEKGKSLGNLNIANNALLGGGAGFLAGGVKGGLLGLGGGIIGGLGGAAQSYFRGDIQQELISKNTDVSINLNNQRNRIANKLLLLNLESNEGKIKADAMAQKGLIQGEINDLENTPGEIVSNQEGGLFLKPFQTPIAMVKMELHSEIKEKLKLYFNKFGNEIYYNFELKTGEKWWLKNVFFNYFKGGDWTNYLHDIGIYDPLIINEFNLEMNFGVRFWHRKYLKGDINNLWEINYYLPNWNIENVKVLL